jgi:outer membrane protein assembly factor BamA
MAFLGLVLVGCRPAKYVPANKYLLNKVRIHADNKKINETELKNYIRQKGNKKILGLRIYLGLYNISNIEKQNGLNKYLRTIGEEPVVWDQNLTNSTLNQMRDYLVRKGYVNASITDTVIHRKRRKVDLVYEIHAGTPYFIRSLKYVFEDTSIQRYLYTDTVNINSRLKIRKQGLFDWDVLINERGNIEYLMRNNGFYRFNRDLISFDVDTTLNSHQVDVVMNVANEVVKLPNGPTVVKPPKQYKIRQVVIRTENDPFKPGTDQESVRKDTIMKYGVKFIYQNNFWVRPSIIQQSNYILPDSLFRISDVEETKTHLSSLNVFSLVNTNQFKEIITPDSFRYNYLDCQVRLTPGSIQSYDIGVVGTNSGGNLGGALNLTYQHQSLFGNAENFNLKFKGALEAVRQKNSSVISQALEYGVEATLNIPKFLIPFNSMGFKKKYNPKTYFKLAYDYQDRPEFKHPVANFSFGYNWKGSPRSTHIITPLEFNYVKVHIKDSAYFAENIKNTYLENLYNNHIVTASSYSFIYNTQDFKKGSDYKYLRWNVESSGNILAFYNSRTNRPKDSIVLSNGIKLKSVYTLLGLQFSQYIKTDIDFHYLHVVNSSNSIAYRLFAGVGFPYGNSKSIPYEKQYFSGGANSIRGWQVLNLGPGSYKDTLKSYPNSTGDIKLEANIEYRSKLFWIFEGALFTDVGNIWLFPGTDKPENGIFRWKNFYKQIAVSSGVGLRLNFNYFLFRLDLGLKMRDPALNEWAFSYKKLMSRDFALSIAIGYPF